MGKWSDMTEAQKEKHRAKSRLYYARHKDEQKKVHRIWYEKHREELSKKEKEYRKLHRDELLAKQKIRSRKHYYADVERSRAKARERTKLYRDRHRDELLTKKRALRQEVVDYYGGKCACCGESEPKFLAIDHIGGGGNKHRREMSANGRGDNFAYWLKRNGFPKGYRILCHNCNMAIGAFGKCPHKENKDDNSS